MIRSLHTSARPGLVSTKTRIEPKTVKDVAGPFCKGCSARTTPDPTGLLYTAHQ